MIFYRYEASDAWNEDEVMTFKSFDCRLEKMDVVNDNNNKYTNDKQYVNYVHFLAFSQFDFHSKINYYKYDIYIILLQRSK